MLCASLCIMIMKTSAIVYMCQIDLASQSEGKVLLVNKFSSQYKLGLICLHALYKSLVPSLVTKAIKTSLRHNTRLIIIISIDPVAIAMYVYTPKLTMRVQLIRAVGTGQASLAMA